MLDAPVMVSRRGFGDSSSAASTSPGSERPGRSALDVPAGRYARPRQQVGVVLDDGGHDHVVVSKVAVGRRGDSVLRSCCGR